MHWLKDGEAGDGLYLCTLGRQDQIGHGCRCFGLLVVDALALTSRRTDSLDELHLPVSGGAAEEAAAVPGADMQRVVV